ncbi:hypothetical protein [Bacillus cereus group sp. MG11]|uniref:hypothetical protein n=1 Tax=Bacillus cereus group sp. MG11 TaxID=3040248 RepID=UPI003393F298
MDKSKYKKHINVSLQNKKYYDSINPILLKWASNSENMSEKVSESILMAVRLESSIGINKLMNTFEMIEKTLQIYFPEKNNTYNEAVEKAFEKIVNVNGAMLSDFITNPVQFSEAQLQSSQKQEPVTSAPKASITEQNPVVKTEEITKSEAKQEVTKHKKEEPVMDEGETTQTNEETPKNVKAEENQKDDTKIPTPKESKEDEKPEKENLPEEPKEDENSEKENLPEEPKDDNQDENEEVEITDADVSLLFGN